MTAKSYRLRVVREGVEFEAEGDKAFVLEMLKRFAPQTPEALSRPAKSGEKEDITSKS